MDIGEPQRRRVVEPIEDPVPREVPAEPVEPVEPEREREPVAPGGRVLIQTAEGWRELGAVTALELRLANVDSYWGAW
jgi:hypothetical protein